MLYAGMIQQEFSKYYILLLCPFVCIVTNVIHHRYLKMDIQIYSQRSRYWGSGKAMYRNYETIYIEV